MESVEEQPEDALVTNDLKDQESLGNIVPLQDSQSQFSLNLSSSGYIDIYYKTEADCSINELRPKPKSKSTKTIRNEHRKSLSNIYERAESEPGVPRPRVIWRDDASSNICVNCSRSFTFFLRKHHCRGCGHLFCDACSGWRIVLPESYALPHRVYNN